MTHATCTSKKFIFRMNFNTICRSTIKNACKGKGLLQQAEVAQGVRGSSTPGYLVLSVATEKIPSNTTGNRSRDSPTSSAVP
jgi:hypothetical protein